MTQFSKRRFLSITLLSLTCLSFFTINAKKQEPSNSAPKAAANQNIDRETFEQSMSEQRKTTEQIGCCVQRLLQTIDAKKINLTKTQKESVVSELLLIQDFVKNILEKLLVQNTPKALSDAIIVNHVLIEHLLYALDTDIASIDYEKIHEILYKKSMSKFQEKELLLFAKKNQETIENLVTATDNVGLKWYNFTYRGLKKHHAYTIAKGIGIATASVFVAAYFASHLEDSLPISLVQSDLWKNYIGKRPSVNKTTGNMELPENVTTDTATRIQRAILTIHKLQESGLITIGALLTISYKDIIEAMYKDPADWAKNKATQKIHEYDQRLQGTAKVDLDKNGYEKVYFKDMVGCAELEELALKIANFMKHPERYERAQIEEHRCILLDGPPQTGKTQFAKALRTLVDEEMGNHGKVHFLDGKEYIDRGCPVEIVFSFAAYHSPCILFFDEIDLVGTHRDKDSKNTSQLLTCIQGIDNISKQIFVIGATNRPEQLDQALLVDGRFGKRIHVEYPKYEYRKTYLTKHIAKRSITNLSEDFIDCIAQETDGCSYNELRRIITEAIILSLIETRPVNQKDFEKALDSEIRKIQSPIAMPQDEKRIIATYQAGKAVARHILQTKQNVVKITINPVQKHVKTVEAVVTIKTDTTSNCENDHLAANKKAVTLKLGEVFTKSNTNHSSLLSDEEQKKECLALLAGAAAQELLLKKSYSQCNKQDRAEAMQIIYAMISGGEKTDEKTKAQAVELKNQYFAEITKLLEEHKDLVQKIADILMKQNTIDRYQWKELIG